MKCSNYDSEHWMAYLYGELSIVERAEADLHLESCQFCRESLDHWRHAIRLLDQDAAITAIVTRPSQTVSRTTALPWAIAAGFALLVGFATGRLTNPSRAEMQTELANLHQSLSREIRQQYRDDLQQVTLSALAAADVEHREWTSAFVAELKHTRAIDRHEWIGALDRLEKQRAAQYLALRSDVFDLARQTRFGFRQTEDNLNLLASSLPLEPDNSSQPNTENSTKNTP